MNDSGSVRSILTKILAKNIPHTTPTAGLVASADMKDLKTFSSETINVLRKVATTTKYNDWMREDERLTVVDVDHKKP